MSEQACEVAAQRNPSPFCPHFAQAAQEEAADAQVVFDLTEGYDFFNRIISDRGRFTWSFGTSVCHPHGGLAFRSIP